MLLAAKVGLSPRASLERVRRLEAAGIIAGYRAVIDLAHLSRPINVFAEIILAKHAQRVLVERRLAAIEDVVADAGRSPTLPTTWRASPARISAATKP